MRFETRTAAPAQVFEELRRLKGEGYNVLIDLTAVDYSQYAGAKRSEPDLEAGLPLDYSVYAAANDRIGWEENFAAGLPPSRTARFELTYRLASLDAAAGLETRDRIELLVPYDEGAALLSARSLWPNADWLEREVWDMFGVKFEDRPDIKRLLLYEEFAGHPLRKDYPIKKRQPLIGPESGELPGSPSFNILRQDIPVE
ncbi:MAG: NADH-quinone oxidoreductase subunit C [Elusimicrobia bacterium]|nr:NADH-quinone oxidoreductase subunit C [Elusimicrobiota bacterium]